MVGRLIEHQQVGVREQHPSQLDPAALASRQHAEREVDSIGLQPKAGPQLPGVGFGRVTAVKAVLLLSLGELFENLWRMIVFELSVEVGQTSGGAVEATPGQYVGEGGVGSLAPRTRVLRYIAERAPSQDQARGWIVFPGQDLQQAGLAGAVAAGPTHRFPGSTAEAR